MQTQTTIQRWGNSLAVRLPRAFIDELKVKQHSPITLTIINGQLMIEPEITLDSFVASMDPNNLHDETGWGEPQGVEVW